eukprot:scaffold3979_cov158-Ochromonas_danica.AAC.3
MMGGLPTGPFSVMQPAIPGIGGITLNDSSPPPPAPLFLNPYFPLLNYQALYAQQYAALLAIMQQQQQQQLQQQSLQQQQLQQQLQQQSLQQSLQPSLRPTNPPAQEQSSSNGSSSSAPTAASTMSYLPYGIPSFPVVPTQVLQSVATNDVVTQSKTVPQTSSQAQAPVIPAINTSNEATNVAYAMGTSGHVTNGTSAVGTPGHVTNGTSAMGTSGHVTNVPSAVGTSGHVTNVVYAVGTSGHVTNVPSAVGSSGHATNVTSAMGTSGHVINGTSAMGTSGHVTNVPSVVGTSGHVTNVPSAVGSSGHATNVTSAMGTSGHVINGTSAMGTSGHVTNVPSAMGTSERLFAHIEDKRRGKWSREENQRFAAAVEVYGYGKWEEIAEYVGTRDANQAEQHYNLHFGEIDATVLSVVNQDAKRKRSEDLPQTTPVDISEPQMELEDSRDDIVHPEPAISQLIAEATAAAKKKRKLGHWTESEHKRFLEGLELYGSDGHWEDIARHVGSRDTMQVYKHFHIVKVTPGYGKRLGNMSESDRLLFAPKEKHSDVNAGPVDNVKRNSGWWSVEEHSRYVEAIERYGTDGTWREVAQHVGTRSVRQVQAHHSIVLSTDNYGLKLAAIARANNSKQGDDNSLDASNSKEQQPNNSNRHSKRRKSAGVWLEVEHQRYLSGLKMFGEDGKWEEIAAHVGSRDAEQVKSHHLHCIGAVSNNDTGMEDSLAMEEDSPTLEDSVALEASAALEDSVALEASAALEDSPALDDSHVAENEPEASDEIKVDEVDAENNEIENGGEEVVEIVENDPTSSSSIASEMNDTKAEDEQVEVNKSSMEEGAEEDEDEEKFNTGRWYRSEHRRYLEGLEQFGDDWELISKYVGSRTSVQVQSHHQTVTISRNFGSKLLEDEDGDINGEGGHVRPAKGMNKVGAWTPEEIEQMDDGIKKFGLNWTKISTIVVTRTPRQVKNRYFYVQAQQRTHQSNMEDDNTTPWTAEERKRYDEAVQRFGCSGTNWSQLAQHIGTRDALQVIEYHDTLTAQEIDNTMESPKAPPEEIASPKKYDNEQNGRGSKDNTKQKRGAWGAEEHKRFLEALEKFGRDDAWDEIAKYVGNRSARQVALHYEDVCNTNWFDKYLDDKAENDNNLSDHDDSVANDGPKFNAGKWGEDEHQRYLQGIDQFGFDWKAVAAFVATRDVKQVLNHHKNAKYTSSVQPPSASKVVGTATTNKTSTTELASKLEEFESMVCSLLQKKKITTMPDLTEFVEWYVQYYQLRDPQTKQIWQCSTKWLRQLSKKFDLHQINE